MSLVSIDLRSSILAAGLALLGAGAAVAQSTPYVCSITQVTECDQLFGCGSVDAMPEQPSPTFIHLNLDSDVATILAPDSRRGETTPFRHESLDHAHVLTGSEGSRAFSMTIVRHDGSMTLSVSDEHVGWVAFGECLAADKLSP